MVSVIMAVYNIGDMQILDQAVYSILNQTISDLELIICDDASTDGTSEHLKELAASDNRIVLLKNENNMLAGQSRNRCIRAAKGEFIAIMDGDDISEPDRLEKQREFLLNNDFDFVGTGADFFNKELGDMGDKKYPFYRFPEKKDFLLTIPFLHASIMFRREVFDIIPGYSSEKIVARNEDYDMLINMYAKGIKGANIEDVLYHYRTDTTAFRRRKYKYRFNEMVVKWRGFCRCGLMPKGVIYAVKPLIIGLVPYKALESIKKKFYERKGD